MDKWHEALIVVGMQRDFLVPGGYAATTGCDRRGVFVSHAA
ncbi:MAG: hypothetical protein AB1400_10635 [Pseudomonadota bacterium]